jgi:dTDP-4-dehydrorhamnose reductase
MIVLIGHGYIGTAIKKNLDAKGLAHIWADHTNYIQEDASLVINATGYTGIPNVDACEQNKDLTADINIRFPVELERLYHLADKPIIHIGSGCVYTGYKVGGWTEEDESNFGFDNGSFYSGTKALAQKIISNFGARSYVLRIRMPFGEERNSKNLLTKLENYPKLVDYRNSLTNIEDLADVVSHFAYTLPPPGVYNVCNPGSITTKEIADKMGLTKEWYTEEEFRSATVAPRSNCVLNVDKLLSVYPMPTLEESLNRVITNYRDAA